MVWRPFTTDAFGLHHQTLPAGLSVSCHQEADQYLQYAEWSRTNKAMLEETVEARTRGLSDALQLLKDAIKNSSSGGEGADYAIQHRRAYYENGELFCRIGANWA